MPIYIDPKLPYVERNRIRNRIHRRKAKFQSLSEEELLKKKQDHEEIIAMIDEFLKKFQKA